MNIENTGYFILNWISKRKRQHKDERSNKTRKQDDSKRKKDILEWINIEKDKDIKIPFSNKYDSVI